MGDRSEIQWTDATWNPVTGCSKVSPGCAYCYAETLTMRYAKGWKVPGLPWTPENAAQNVILKPERLDQPLKWTKPRMIFVNSMSDLFHELVPDDYIAEVFAVMSRASHHIFQVLTKRPERARDLLADDAFLERVSYHRAGIEGELVGFDWPIPNVWLGTTIENRQYVGRADALRAAPAAVRFLSAEPLLGPLIAPMSRGGEPLWNAGKRGPELDLSEIDWLIVGGESAGPAGRRLIDEFGPTSLAKRWVGDLRDAAQESGTAFFFKQWGGRTPKAGGRLLDGREWNEMPAALPSAEEAVR